MTTACTACGHDNRDGRRFCAECGQALGAAICPSCGAANETGEKFCGDCGAALTPVQIPPRSSPAAVAVAGEKKHITVLFADVAGSMDLQERLDAEVWAQIMGRFVQVLAEGVRKFGGTVDKFTGDGIMALFGAPVAQEDHARRACHAAWHLTKAIGEYSEELRQSHDVELQVRLGLNSGEVVVGRVGEDVTLDPTALGHTVGLAQRMEAMAEPGTAYLTGDTVRLIEGWFEVQGLGRRAVKGASDPLSVHVLGPPLGVPVRRLVGGWRLVGRDRELAVLEEALAMAMQGHAQVVGIVGEAGVGKSRLCDEFAASAEARNITVRRAAGVSHGKDLPLLPILSFQRAYFGIIESDDVQEARAKVANRLLELDPALEEVLPLMLDFLEVADPNHPVPLLAPEVRMRRIFDAVRRITARRSERETLVLIFEDLHWFDPQSEAFLERLIESYPGSRTLVVTNFRPEFSAGWMRHSYYRQLPLIPLPETAVADLLGGLLGVDVSLAPLLRFVLERTGGNPFFVEEVVRALVENGTLTGQPGNYQLTSPLHEVTIPASVQAVLAARIDRLASEHKALLQAASVIGRTFDTVVLGRITGLSADSVEETLSALCAAELLQETTRNATVEYRFWHPLTQEVAYGTVLAEQRARLHGEVADALVELEPDRADERAAVIAWHLQAARRPLDAARWALQAGGWSLRSDLAEAQRRWRIAIELADAVEESPASLEIGVWARARLLQFGARTSVDPDEAERLFLETRLMAERLGDRNVLAFVIAVSGSQNLWAGDPTGALERYREAAHLAVTCDDPEFQATICVAPPLALVFTGPLAEGLDWTDRVLKVCADNPEQGVSYLGYSPLTRILNSRARLLARAGRLAEAAQDNQRCVRLARSRGETEMLCWALSLVAELAWLTGEGDGGLPAAEEALQLAEDTGNTAGMILGLESIAMAQVALSPSEAIHACQRALAAAREHRSGLFEEPSALAHIARARHAAGDPDGARVAAEEAVAVARGQGARVVECLALLTRAQVQRATDAGPEKVLADVDAALALARDTDALTYEPFILEELSRLHDDEIQLRGALRLYRKIGATGHARRLEAELSARVNG
jgi:adenylate cyclase